MTCIRWIETSACAFLAACFGVVTAAPASDVATELNLETAQQIALRENPTLQSAGARIRQAEGRLAQVNATYWPRLGVGTSAFRTKISDRTIRRAEDALNPFDEDFEARIEKAIDDTIADVFNGTRRAREAVRDEILRRLKGNPDLAPILPPLVEEAGKAQDFYADALQSELSNINPVDSLVETLGIDTDPMLDDQVTTYRAGGYASWLLFDGFARRFRRSAARYGHDMSEESRRDSQRLLLGAVAGAYYQAQLAREETTIAQADLEFNARLLEEAKKRREVGQASLSTELNFEVRRNVAETAMLNAQRQYEGSLVALATLLGYPTAALPTDVILAPLQEESPEEMEPPPAESSIEYALDNRPDVKFASNALTQKEFVARIARSDYAPTINVTGGYGGIREDNPGFNEEDFGGSVGVVLTMDLFEGGGRRARIREAVAVRDDAAAALAQTKLTAASEVRGAIVSLRFAGELLTLQRSNLTTVKRTRDLVEQEYKANHASLVRLNESQRDLVLARSRYATALAALHVAWHELLQSTAQSLRSVEED